MMISVLIPLYNGAEFLDESVSSVLNQTYSDWELIIGVNGHAENSETFQLAKQFEQRHRNIQVLDLFTIKGKSNALNKMIKYCKYEYVALLDVDDIWYPAKLEMQLKLLHEVDVIGTNCVYFGDRTGAPKIPKGDISHASFAINPIINSSAVIRKCLCWWNNKHDGIEDYDLWLTLKKQHKTFYNLKETLVRHRIHKLSAFNAKGNHKKVAALVALHNNTTTT